MAKITLDEMNPNMKAKQEELLGKFEKESKTRTFDHVLLVKLVYYLTIGIALYHFITSFCRSFWCFSTTTTSNTTTCIAKRCASSSTAH